MTAKSRFPTMRSETLTVSIRRSPQDVWDAASDVAMWPELTHFLLGAKQVASDEYKLTTPRGAGKVQTRFDRDQLMLDHLLVVPVRTKFSHACRLLPNHHGCEVVLTIVMTGRETPADFEQRIAFLREFLDCLRDVLEDPARA